MEMESKTRAQIFGNNLARIRKEKGYSRKELADAVGLTENAFGFYERGTRFAPLDKLFELAKVLNVTIADLTGENPRIDEKKVFDYRFDRAVNIAEQARCTVMLVNGEISLTLPRHISREGDPTQFSVVFDIGFAPVKFKSKQDFIEVIETAELRAISGDRIFSETLREYLFPQKK